MSIRITKNKIHASGSDANGLFVAMAPDETLITWCKGKVGSEEFQSMVTQAIKARGLEGVELEHSEP